MMVSAPLLASAPSHHLLHVARRHELALLDVHRLAEAAQAWMKSVWRHRKAGVCSTSTTAATAASSMLGVHVGQHRHAELLLHVGEDVQPLLHAQAAERLARAAIGLVVGRLVDEVDAQRAADFRSCPAVSSAISRDSMTQGPAIRNSGWSSPTSKAAQLHARLSIWCRRASLDALARQRRLT
jgi:hypothetical protein